MYILPKIYWVIQNLPVLYIFSVHPHHLETLLSTDCQALPWSSWFSLAGVGLRICIPNSGAAALPGTTLWEPLHLPHLGACQVCRVSGPTSYLLHQHLNFTEIPWWVVFAVRPEKCCGEAWDQRKEKHVSAQGELLRTQLLPVMAQVP